MSLREWQEIQEVLRRLTQAVLSFCASVEARGAPTPREFMAADYVTDPPTIAAWFVVGLGLLQTGRVAAQRAEAP